MKKILTVSLIWLLFGAISTANFVTCHRLFYEGPDWLQRMTKWNHTNDGCVGVNGVLLFVCLFVLVWSAITCVAITSKILDE